MVFNFDLEETEIFQSLKWGKNPIFRWVGFFKKLFLILAVFSLFLLGFSLGLALKIFILFSVIFIFFWQINLFFNLKIKNPKLKTTLFQALSDPKVYNLAKFLDFEAAEIVWDSIKFCKKRKIFDISSTALLYSSLKENTKINFIFFRLGLDIAGIQEKAKNYLEKSERKEDFREAFTRDFQDAMFEAAKISQKRKKEKIGPREILIGVSKHSSFFKDILIKADFKEEDIENIALWSDFLEERIEKRKKFWERENLAKYGSLGKDWAMGYTIILDQFSIDWREVVKNWFFKTVIGHEKKIRQVERILVGPKMNNVLLVGEPGTGRKSIIEAIAHRSFLGASLTGLNYQRVMELDMVSLLSQIQNPEEIEATLDKIFQEAVLAGNVILVIDGLQKYVEVKVFKPGAIDITGILSKYLQFSQFRFIGITDYSGLHRQIEQNPSFLALLNKIEVSEISEAETIKLLENSALELEQKYKIFLTYPAIREIVNLTDRYMPSQYFPEKALELLDEVAVYAATSLKGKMVLPHHVAKVLSEKIEIPVGEVEAKEREILLNLEKLIHQKIINQEEAVKEISTALKRARAGIASKKRPMGVFLFLGPTGVGKTETSKALAEIYFGGEGKMIRLDMSEFQAISDIQRLIGAPEQEGLLTTPVKENPFSLILMDEVEKAHPDILNLFLQVFDEGHITDGQGKKVSFTNSIIICTSNAGAQIIFKNVKLNKQLNIVKDELLDFFFEKGFFRPEFINRYDAVVIFKPLTKENLLDICQLMLGSLQKNLKEKGIEFVITKPLKEKIVELSYNPAFGAREMRRVIQDKIENVLAQALLSDQIKRGDRVEIESLEFKLIVNP